MERRGKGGREVLTRAGVGLAKEWVEIGVGLIGAILGPFPPACLVSESWELKRTHCSKEVENPSGGKLPVAPYTLSEGQAGRDSQGCQRSAPCASPGVDCSCVFLTCPASSFSFPFPISSHSFAFLSLLYFQPFSSYWFCSLRLPPTPHLPTVHVSSL